MRSTHLLALAAASLLSVSAQAAPFFYTTENAFLKATSDLALSLSLETFDAHKPPTRKVIDNLTSGLNIESNTNLFDVNNSNYCAGTGNCISFTTPSGGSLQTFTFDSGSVNAFGVFLGDLADTGGTILTLTTSTGATQSYSLNLPNNTERYFGIIDMTSPFTSVSLRNSDSGDGVFIDNVRWGKAPVAPQNSVVPEPGMLALLGVSLAGVALVRRRQA